MAYYRGWVGGRGQGQVKGWVGEKYATKVGILTQIWLTAYLLGTG